VLSQGGLTVNLIVALSMSKILVVEDTTDLAQLIALEIHQTQQPDLLIVDWILPELDYFTGILLDFRAEAMRLITKVLYPTLA
jgi:PleD family two-component response regulator